MFARASKPVSSLRAPAGAQPRTKGAALNALPRDTSALELYDRMSRREQILNDAERVAQLGAYEEDLESGTIWNSDGLCRILGVDPLTFRGTDAEWMARVHPDDRETVLGHYRALVAGGAPYDYEHRIVRPDGEVRIVRRRGHAVVDEAGRTIRVCSTILDLTEQRTADAARNELERRFENAFESAPLGMSMWSVQPESFGRILEANEAFCTLTGYRREELLTMNGSLLVHPEDHDAALAVVRDLIAGEGCSAAFERRTLRKDGTSIWVRQHHSLVRDGAGRPQYVFSHSEDVSRMKADAAALAAANERLRHSFEHAPVGMAIVGIDDEAFGLYLDVNVALCQMFGYEREELLTMGSHVVMHPEDVPEDAVAFKRLVAGDYDSYEAERRYVRSDGQVLWGILHRSLVRDPGGRPLYSVSQLVDITRRKLAETKLQHLADHDPLTGLLNRRCFGQRLEQHLSEARRYHRRSAVLLIDLDRFKYINDTLGHAAGDELLQKVARELRRRCRASDVLARLGGDEFAVLLHEVDAANAQHVAEELRRTIKENVQLCNGRELHVTASIGLTVVEGTGHESAQEVIAAADIAMYRAKESGRDRSCASSSTARSDATTESELLWSQRVRHALENDRFVLFQQPILNLSSGTVDRHELLLRMRDDDGSYIAPGAFLGAAQRFGMMQEIDKWVVREAIRLVEAEQRAGRIIRVEVNLAGPSLNDASVMACIEEELRRASIDPSSLIFEVTETEAIGSMGDACRFAQRLSDLGCGFALDDFGAGFSSFYYLKNLPFEYLKIDGAFIENLRHNAVDREIVKAFVQLAAGMGKQTIAEFVGDDETIELLREYGVHFAQGYQVGKPMPIEDRTAAAHDLALPA